MDLILHRLIDQGIGECWRGPDLIVTGRIGNFPVVGTAGEVVKGCLDFFVENLGGLDQIPIFLEPNNLSLELFLGEGMDDNFRISATMTVNFLGRKTV